jgi:hypothetical protein
MNDTAVSLEILLSPSARRSFVETLLAEFESIMIALSKLDSRKAEALYDSDRDMILKTIEDSVGHAQMNELVAKLMRKWLSDSAEHELKAQDSSTASRDKALQKAELLCAVGKLHFTQGRVGDSLLKYKVPPSISPPLFPPFVPFISVVLRSISKASKFENSFWVPPTLLLQNRSDS